MFTETYKRYALFVLTLTYTLSLVDQSFIDLLAQTIKDDLHLSDTRLGALTGVSFALFYSILGIPFARWADRGNRVTITGIAIALWGVGVTATLFVTGFWPLVFARMLAAVGAAGCMPATYSLLGDYCTAASERTRAMSIYMLANPISVLAGFTLGGWVNHQFGWRTSFLLMGAPALVIAAIIRLTIREPRRMHVDRSQALDRNIPRVTDVVKTLWSKPATRHLILGVVLYCIESYGQGAWYAAFLMRSHAMSTADAGIWLGLIFGLCGIFGTLFGGYVVGHWLAQDERGQMRVIAVAMFSLMPLLALVFLMPDTNNVLIVLVPETMMENIFLAPTYALLQRLVEDEMRATSMAVVMLLVHLIGMALGPQVVGILSDWLSPALGSDSLRYAMLIISCLALWSGYHFWQVGRTVREELSLAAPYSAPFPQIDLVG